MSRYEYKIELKDYKNHYLASDKKESDFLNEYGDLGWELVSVVYENMGIDTQPSFLMRYYFKKKYQVFHIFFNISSAFKFSKIIFIHF